MLKTVSSITFAALAIATISLILAIAPPVVIESKINRLEKEGVEYKKKYSIKIKDMEIGFSNGEKTDNYKENILKIEKLKNAQDYFNISSLALGAVALLVSIFSLLKKQNFKFGIGSIVIACVAMVWQYISTGITIGVAIFVLIVLLMNFGV